MTKISDMNRQLAAFSILALGLLLVPFEAPAQQFEEIGDYRVHYSAMNTRMLPPEVAGAYGITRSGSRAMLNIAVLRKAESDSEMDSPVRAAIAVSAVNLTGQPRRIEMREIEEEDAIYYIGTFRISDEETLTFTVDVNPEDSGTPAREFSFQQKFYVEE